MDLYYRVGAERDLGTPAANGMATAGPMVNVAIDGRSIAVPEGTSVMRAAALAGAGIPKLCATEDLAAFGSCRLCLVEIEGRKGYPASCTTLVEEGMAVRTQTDRLAELRRNVMELYISDHPLDCLTCAANGDCELQDMAGAVGLREVRYGYQGAIISTSRRMNPPLTSALIRPSASSAPAACAPARSSRAPTP